MSARWKGIFSQAFSNDLPTSGGTKIMDGATYEAFRELIYQKSGINLGASKKSLLTSRLAKRLRVLGITDYKNYLEHISHKKNTKETEFLIDAISTNVTSFFREPDHFSLLESLIDRWSTMRKKRIRLWSAACSSGEEPYSIAMTILNKIDPAALDIKILATDISSTVLYKSTQGIYDTSKLKALPTQIKQAFFHSMASSNGSAVEIKQTVKQLVTFSRLNLSAPPYPMKGPMDVIFCRNVMIYFDEHVRGRLIKEFSRLLNPGGHLIIGHSETIKSKDFSTLQPSVLVKK